MDFDAQSIKDLEFDEIRERLSKYCKSKKAKEKALKIRGLNSLEEIQNELSILKEVREIHAAEDLSMPHPASDSIDGALKLLHVRNGVLTLDELLRVYTLCLGTKKVVEFARKNKHNYPLIYEATAHINEVDSILDLIKEVVNEKNEIRDDASPQLASIRKQYASNHREINKNFDKALKKYKKDGILADTIESFLDEKRVLAVDSSYKGRVEGKPVGVSAKGNVTYMEPGTNLRLNQHQAQLRMEERAEIFKILSALTDKLRGRKRDLEAFQRLLVRFDIYNAKVLFGNSYVGILPKINDQKLFEWQDAKHPLLLLTNNALGVDTIGQQIELNEKQRFLVISGPNAGGKSITLKTVGLIQMMFQCGLLVPLKEGSTCCWFDDILSDIGDNQSIQDQLSTYSYRLNRMEFFLHHANENSLLLLDEFGSGSDPELGGALAEVFYEELYNKKAFAVITTHYANIKIKSAAMEEAMNACMLFDSERLTPLYKLSIGQPGSSFTFEVAKLNGISDDLINRAKEKVSKAKLEVDELTAELQKEKAALKKLNESNRIGNLEASKSKQRYEDKLRTLNEKAEKQTAYLEQQHKYVNAGKKIFDFIKKYERNETNKALNEAVKRYVSKEKQKILELKKAQKEAAKKNKLQKAAKVNEALLMDKELEAPKLPKSQKGDERKAEKKLAPAPTKALTVGDIVQLKTSKKKGKIVEISGKKIIIEVGNFRITTKVNELE
ncbi:MAG: DNA mismatch repair protein MutS [Crocinitomicaceae bacterium]|nr:DNA mismatch repair protein MutS [Crocinitomicaceae bacterium]